MKTPTLRIVTIAFLLLLSFVSFSQQWQQVGKVGEWSTTIDVIAMNGFLYSIEKDGTLFKSDKNGNHQQV